MDLKKLVMKLEESPVFKEWRDGNRDAFLSSAFVMLEKEGENEWMFDYYDREKDRITSFLVSDVIKINPESEIFKTGNEIKGINIDDVKMDFNNVLDIGMDFCKKEFPREILQKTIAILQNMELGQVWNLTYITFAYKTINVKISTNSGEILKHSCMSLYDFMPKND